VAACVLARVLRVLRVLRVRVLLRALVLVRVLRHARVRVLWRALVLASCACACAFASCACACAWGVMRVCLGRHAGRPCTCAACACASTRAVFLVPPNSWQPRDTTTVCVLVVRVRRT